MLDHMGFHKTQVMERNGLLPTEIANWSIPLHGSCKLGKQKRNPVSTNGGGSSLKKDKVYPGDLIHSNQFSSPLPGLISQFSTKLVQRSFHYEIMHVDSSSEYFFYVSQETKEAKETVDGKHKFEGFWLTHGVDVTNYRADNHV